MNYYQLKSHTARWMAVMWGLCAALAAVWAIAAIIYGRPLIAVFLWVAMFPLICAAHAAWAESRRCFARSLHCRLREADSTAF